MENQPRYSGGIETRTEVDATNFELRRCYEAAKKLKRTGSLIPAAGLELYHGRAFEGDFVVNPFFNNSGNNTGNHNINKGEKALHVASYQTAKEFANARALSKGTEAEIVKMTIPDEEASFFDCSRDPADRAKHVEEDRKGFAESLPDPIASTVLSMEDYQSIDHRALDFFIQHAARNPIIPKERVPEIAKILHISVEGASKLVGSINARSSVLNSPDPHGRMTNNIYGLLDYPGDVVTLSMTVTGTGKDGKPTEQSMDCPINREYIHQWMRDMHIIGIKGNVQSATLGFKLLTDAYEVFSLDEIKSVEQREAAKESRKRNFGSAALRIHRIMNKPESAPAPETPLSYLSMDRRITPRELIDSAKRVSQDFQNLFEGDAGNREGFTIEEHTETALELFDSSYKSNLPRSVFDFGRLCLLVHDIGKGEARRNGQAQNSYNAQRAAEFLQSIGAPREVITAIPIIITEGMDAAHGTVVEKTPQARSELWRVSCKITQTLFHIDERSGDYTGCVNAVYNLCRALMECDGASYSEHAVTRRRKDNLTHRNNNTRFGATFNSNNEGYIRAKK